MKIKLSTLKPTLNSLFFIRLMIVTPFLWAGFTKIMGFSQMVDFIGKSTPLPLPTVALLIAIIIEIPVALMFVWGCSKKNAAIALGVFTVIATILFHNPFVNGTLDGMQLIQVLKNTAIIGGLWAVTVCACETCKA